jgi:hypothetical protein
MSRTSLSTVLKITAVALPIFAGVALAAQDRYTLTVPNGLAFSEFKGYEKWQVVAASHSDETVQVILANPMMIAAYEAGFPANGKKIPDGARMAKIHWNKKKNPEGFPIQVPDTLHDVDLMAKDSKRFADSGGWGYAQFNYDAASDSFTPLGTGAKCGFACHTAAAAKDYVFTAYPKR